MGNSPISSGNLLFAKAKVLLSQGTFPKQKGRSLFFREGAQKRKASAFLKKDDTRNNKQHCFCVWVNRSSFIYITPVMYLLSIKNGLPPEESSPSLIYFRRTYLILIL